MAQDDTPATGDQPGVSGAAGSHPPVVVKKYANRRLYNTESSSYITLDNLAEMVRAGRDFTVYDAKSGEDITRGVLTQIIVEEESKGSSMLPTAFLRQLIGFYGDSLQGVVPRYLEHTMAVFARQQQTMRQTMQQTINPFLPPGVPFLPPGVEEMGRQNMAVFERALSLFNPFHRGPAAAAPPAPAAEPAEPSPERREMERLREEVDRLNGQLAAARAQIQDARERAEATRAARPKPAAPAAADAGPRERGGDAPDPAPQPGAPAGAPAIAPSPPASRGARRGRGKPGQGTTRA